MEGIFFGGGLQNAMNYFFHDIFCVEKIFLETKKKLQKCFLYTDKKTWAVCSRLMSHFKTRPRLRLCSGVFLFLRLAHCLLGLTVLLCFDHSTKHSDRHGDADDEHRCRLSQTQLTVQGRQGAAGQLGRSAADDVPVVVHSQMSNPVDLPEDALQVTVTGPGVGGHLEVCGGGLEHQEGLELDVLQLVCLEAEQSQTPERSQSFSLDH